MKKLIELWWSFGLQHAFERCLPFLTCFILSLLRSAFHSTSAAGILHIVTNVRYPWEMLSNPVTSITNLFFVFCSIKKKSLGKLSFSDLQFKISYVQLPTWYLQIDACGTLKSQYDSKLLGVPVLISGTW